MSVYKWKGFEKVVFVFLKEALLSLLYCLVVQFLPLPHWVAAEGECRLAYAGLACHSLMNVNSLCFKN